MPFQLIRYAKEGKITPYTKHGHRVCDAKIKERYEGDKERRRLLELELCSLQTYKVLRPGNFKPHEIVEMEKKQIEDEIKEIDSKEHEPLPEKYNDCVFWESFDLPQDQKQANKILEKFREYIYLKDEVERLKPCPAITQGIAAISSNTEKINSFCEQALKTGYTDTLQLPQILGHDRQYGSYHIERLWKELQLDRKAPSKPDTKTFNDRVRAWNHIIQRLVSGYDVGARKSEYKRPAPTFLPLYKDNKKYGRSEKISKEELKTGISEEQIKLTDLLEYFHKYLNLPIPEMLFPDIHFGIRQGLINNEADFKDKLNLSVLRSRAKEWVIDFPAIIGIFVFRSKNRENNKYVFDCVLDREHLSYADYMNWKDEACRHIWDAIADSYADSDNIGEMDIINEWAWFDRNIDEPLPDEFIIREKCCFIYPFSGEEHYQVIEHEEQREHKKHASPEYVEQQVKKFQIRYDNDLQFEIKAPGKAFKPCTYHDLGCRDSKTNEFKWLLKVIKYGEIKLSNRNSQKAFERGCKKLSDYIRENYLPDLPEDFKIFDKDREKNSWLIFKSTENQEFTQNWALEEMSKNELLTELKCLTQEPVPQKVKDVEKWREIQQEKIIEYAHEALERGVDPEEIKNIIDPHSFKDFYGDETREYKPDDIAKASIYGQGPDDKEN
jgi:hypothetical protein